MLELLQKRRSIRSYKSETIGEERLQKILQAALLSPSSRNRAPWEFVVVEEKGTLQRLEKCRHPQQNFLPAASVAVVVVGDPAVSDVWIEDCSIAMILMQLEAERLGLGSCWVQIRRRMAQGEAESSSDYVKTLLHIPSQYEVLAILALGVPAEEKAKRNMNTLQTEKIHRESF